VGAPGTFEAGPEPGHRQRADCDESARSTPLAPGLASKNGLTREELVETITHLAFYSGWPSSVTAATIAKDVLLPAK
jgi:hypothetical protein